VPGYLATCTSLLGIVVVIARLCQAHSNWWGLGGPVPMNRQCVVFREIQKGQGSLHWKQQHLEAAMAISSSSAATSSSSSK
jgi:hypothetical protein